MSGISLIATMLILLVSTPAFAQQWYELEWKEWRSQKDFFGVSFPGEPTVRETTFATEYSNHKLPARIYSYESGPNRFSATVVDYSSLKKLEAERVVACRLVSDGDTCMDTYLHDMRGAVIFAIWSAMKKSGGKVTIFSYARTELVEGQEVYLDNPDGSQTITAAFMHKDLLYILDSKSPGSAPPPTLFYKTLEFLDENGKTIRYQTPYANGLTTPARNQ